MTRSRTVALLAVTASAVGCGSSSHGPEKAKRSAAPPAPALGGRIAFRRYFNDQQTTGAVFTIDPDGSHERQLTHPPAGVLDDQPAWSPDGRRVAFTRCKDGGVCSAYVVDADGSGAHPVVSCAGGKVLTRTCPDTADVAFAPDGKHLLLTAAWGSVKSGGGEDQIQNSQIRMVDLRGHTTRALVTLSRWHGDADWGTLSPDGRMLAYELNVSLAGRHTIMVVNLASGGQRRVIPWKLRGGDGVQWSRDGSRLLFRSHEDGHEDSDYYTVRPDGSGLARLTRFKDQSIYSAAWSPDGKWIVFAKTGRGFLPDLFVMKADGTAVRQVTRTPAWDSAPDWGPAPPA
jgi:Tol biopolymer transport system component